MPWAEVPENGAGGKVPSARESNGIDSAAACATAAQVATEVYGL